MRLAVARLRFCSNSFTPLRTGAEDMLAHEWATGPAALRQDSAEAGEIEGLRQFLAARPGWEPTMLRCASAPPGGPLTAELFGGWLAEVEDALRRGRFDAVYLSLHGACQAEGDPAADMTILRRIRAAIGRTPVVASFDIRANLSEEVAILLDGASTARAWPQGGGIEAAGRALGLLEGLLAGRWRPVGALARVPMIMQEPMLAEALGEVWRGGPPALPRPVLDSSVFGGFAWGDSPFAGPSAMAWADRDAGAARDMAAHLAASLMRWRTRGAVPPPPPEAALAALLHARDGSRPVLLLDPADDPACGGLADTPGLLRALLMQASAPGTEAGPGLGHTPGLAQRVGGRALVAAFCDPGAVASARTGAVADLVIGGHTTPAFGLGVPIRGEVIRMAGGDTPGGFALLRVEDIDILLTATRPPVITPDWLACFGIDIGAYRLLAIKGGAASRAAFAGRVAAVMRSDCPGPGSPDLLRLPFLHVSPARRAAAGLDQTRHDRPDPPAVSATEPVPATPA